MIEIVVCAFYAAVALGAFLGAFHHRTGLLLGLFVAAIWPVWLGFSVMASKVAPGRFTHDG